MIKAVLFDFDHTLVSTPIDFGLMRRSVVQLCGSFGVTVPEPDTKLVLEIVDEAVAQLDPVVGARLRGMADNCIREVERGAARGVLPIAGVAEALDRLRAEGRLVAIITRNCREVVLAALRRVPLAYDLLLTRDDVDKVKPDPAHALAALAALDTDRAHALLVGDFRADIACATRAGLPGLGVTTGASTAEELFEAGAVDVLTSAAGVPDWLAAREW
ncbi:MAG: HAD family hydrolase [Armatimonadetes bacterium]|nr:HAD family hydrolase [Armatimonadota bacterium]